MLVIHLREKIQVMNNLLIKKTPKIISGFSKNCLNLMDALYKNIINKRIKSDDLKSAELSKLFRKNLYRAVNIGLINELKIICDYLRIDIFKVIDLASTKILISKFLPGPGLEDIVFQSIHIIYLDIKKKDINLSLFL